jgi:hypothetical protein
VVKTKQASPDFPLLSKEGWLRALFARSRGGVLQGGYTTLSAPQRWLRAI